MGERHGLGPCRQKIAKARGHRLAKDARQPMLLQIVLDQAERTERHALPSQRRVQRKHEMAEIDAIELIG